MGNDLEEYIPPLFYYLSKKRFYNPSTNDIHKYQTRKATQVVNFAVNNSSFYKDYYKNYDLRDPWSLPTTNKKVLMDNFDIANTAGLTKSESIDFCMKADISRDFTKRLKGINVGMSSGTSGNKGIEVASRNEELLLKSAFLSRLKFPIGFKANIAFILRVTSPAFKFNFMGHKMNYINQLTSLEDICSNLEKINPNILAGPPSMLNLIATEVSKGKYHISPKLIYSYAEILYPDVKVRLENIYKCPIRQIYKCTEGFIAISCNHGSLHINEDLVAIQLGGDAPHKVIITDLHKKSLPIIRYELNDLITLSDKKCGCGSGFRVIERIDGRCDDMFYGIRKDTGELQFVPPDLITRWVNMSSEDILDYQVIEKSPKDMIVYLVVIQDADYERIIEKIQHNILELFSNYECVSPKIIFERRSPEVNKNSGKLIRLHRDYEVNV